MKKKILVLTTTYPRWVGDVEPAFVHNLSVELARHYDVLVLTPHTRNAAVNEVMDGVNIKRYRYLPFHWQGLCYDGGIVPKLKSQPFRAVEIPFLLLGMLWQGWWQIRQHKIDVIHAHWVIPQGFIAVCLSLFTGRKIKVLVTSHGADLYALKSPLLVRLKQWVFKQASCAAVVSEAMQSYCVEVLKLDSAPVVASMGVDCQHKFVARTPMSERSGVLFVGRLVEKKGVHYLIEAFARWLKLHPHERLTIVGDGPERLSLERDVARLGIDAAVTFVGAVDAARVAAYFNKAKIAVMPSLVAGSGDQEGLGLVAAEAIACGCITLVSDIAAVQDVHNEKRLQFRQGDSESLFERLCFVQENPLYAEELSASLKQRVVETFDWQAVGERYHQLISRCLLK